MRGEVAWRATYVVVCLGLCAAGCRQESHNLAGKWKADISDGLFEQFRDPIYTFEWDGKFNITAQSVMLPGGTLRVKGAYKVTDNALTLRANFFGVKMANPKLQAEADETLRKISADAFLPMNEDSVDMKLKWDSARSVSFTNARGATTHLTKIAEEIPER